MTIECGTVSHKKPGKCRYSRTYFKDNVLRAEVINFLIFIFKILISDVQCGVKDELLTGIIRRTVKCCTFKGVKVGKMEELFGRPKDRRIDTGGKYLHRFEWDIK